MNPGTIVFGCEAILAKFLMADKYLQSFCSNLSPKNRYKPKRIYKGQIHLIRAEQGAARGDDVGSDYGVGNVFPNI